MPAAYQHLRVRLHIEQTRLLNWGQKVGLAEELLESPSQILQLQRNLIIDILLEVQTLFKSIIKIKMKYDSAVSPKPLVSRSYTDFFSRRFAPTTNNFLRRTLLVAERVPEVSKRLQWAVVKHERFRDLIEKLIGYNDSMEALLDRTTIDSLHGLQQQTHLMMLQLNSRVEELTEVSLAMQIGTQTPENLANLGSPMHSAVTLNQQTSNASLASLADFKSQQASIELEKSYVEPVKRSEIKITTVGINRSEAVYQKKHVWIEWKIYSPECVALMEDRIMKLAILLGSEHKPEQFGAPHCMGYFGDVTDRQHRFGMIYAKPPTVQRDVKPVSLQDLIRGQQIPSLNKRVTLAHAVARCLMYLHAVNWLHKCFRSDNVVFFTPPGCSTDYATPLLCGYEYARPDLSDEPTEEASGSPESDLYRHPSVLDRADPNARSRKSHDIYSLGVVLVEIAHWEPVEQVVNRLQNSKTCGNQEILLSKNSLTKVESIAGEAYAKVVQKCLIVGEELGLYNGADETDPQVGAEMQRIFARDLVDRLSAIRL